VLSLFHFLSERSRSTYSSCPGWIPRSSKHEQH
jgi:hypothetical protein